MALNPTDGIRSAPTTKMGILRNIGPGMILAGSIVGSGELIATTRTGAEAGFDFLWLIIFGCIIRLNLAFCLILPLGVSIHTQSPSAIPNPRAVCG